MDAALVIISIIVAIIGFLNLTEATLGVGLIGLAALLGIYARIVQADNHVKQLREQLEVIKRQLKEMFTSKTES